MASDVSNRGRRSAICGAICALVVVASWLIIFYFLPGPEGSFSYTRFYAACASCVLGIAGVISAFLGFRRLQSQGFRLLCRISLIFNGLTSIFASFFVVAAILLLKEEHKIKEDEARSSTNVLVLASAEFHSNLNFYSKGYGNTVGPLKEMAGQSISSLRSKDNLKSREEKISASIKAGVELRNFCSTGPAKFIAAVQNSDKTPDVKKARIKDFKRAQLKSWDENTAILEQTLHLMSNLLVLDQMLETNFDQWHLSNSAIVFDDARLGADYREKAAVVKQEKTELNLATAHFEDLNKDKQAK